MNMEKVIVDKTKIDAMSKLTKLVESEEVLLTVDTVFPFTFFPDKLIVTKEKVSIVNEIFFFSKQVRSVLIRDIATVQAETGLFFGKLVVIDKNFQALPITVTFLKAEDALEARRVIQGLIVIAREKMDIAQVAASNITKTVGELGSSRSDQLQTKTLDESGQ